MTSRRGGKHVVKDADLTHTKYDEYTREQLLVAVREAGCYTKDDKKSVMARKMADHDQRILIENRRAVQERKDKEEQQQKQAADTANAIQTRRKARAKRNKHRNERREYAEDVSSDSDDTEDFEERNRIDAHKLTVIGGEALSDESWDDSDSESSVRSVNPRITPSCRLRLFEWSYTTMPSSEPPSDPRFERFPTALPYTPLKLLTAFTNEKIALPGLKYPTGVAPDSVPILDAPTRLAARHGHTVGLLANATIEPAALWAARTVICGWNGRMYFSLPTNNAKDISLDDVYSRWRIDNALLLRPTPGITDVKQDLQLRASQRLSLKRKRMADVYEASKWRPLAMGYMPAYLEWEAGLEPEQLEGEEQTLGNLFFVRFQGCGLPHYYFWAREGEWADPTVPDPSWSLEAETQADDDDDEVMVDAPSTKVRVEKSPAPSGDRADSFLADYKLPTVSSIEYDLRVHGLTTTFAKVRHLAQLEGEECAWTAFTYRFPVLYPSGVLPQVPPLEGHSGICLAEKIIALLLGQEVQPFSGEESWTRDDDCYWDVISVQAGDDFPTEESMSSNTTSMGPPHFHTSSPPPSSQASGEPFHALFRHACFDLEPIPQLRGKDPRILSWLHDTPSTFPPRSLPVLHPLTKTPHNTEDPDKKKCAQRPPRRLDPARLERFGPVSASYSSRQTQDTATTEDSPSSITPDMHTDTSETCPFCSVPCSSSSTSSPSNHSHGFTLSMTETEKATHMLLHSAPSLVESAAPKEERILAQGIGARLQESLLGIRTLQSYSGLGGKGGRGKRRRVGLYFEA